MKVLIIEDEKRLAVLLQKGLTENGFTVDSCFDGQEGLDMAQNYPSSITVMGSRMGLEETFLNIIENGIRYHREGGTITVTATIVGKNAVVTIADTGMGIARFDLPKIFERFYRASAVRNTEGTGLGLSIAKSVVTAHNGEIMVESEPGAGSRFTILLPQHNDHEHHKEHKR